MVVGLANPGDEFSGTRHNVGGAAVELLASRLSGTLRPERGLDARAVVVTLGDRRLLLAVPTTYMNESGRAVARVARRAGIDPRTEPERIVVVHDELDLPPGRLKLKAGGGTAGHNGLRSLDSHLHTRGYTRVRIGIGKPPGRQPGADYVLRRPSSSERALLEVAVAEAADAVELLATDGIDAAMNRFNSTG